MGAIPGVCVIIANLYIDEVEKKFGKTQQREHAQAAVSLWYFIFVQFGCCLVQFVTFYIPVLGPWNQQYTWKFKKYM